MYPSSAFVHFFPFFFLPSFLISSWPNAPNLHLSSSLDGHYNYSLPYIHPSSMHRTKMTNKFPTSSDIVPYSSKDLPIRECSSQSGSKQSSSSTDAKLLSGYEDQPVPTQFFLCQPYPRIPRPPNGEWKVHRSWLSIADNNSLHIISPALASSSSGQAPRSGKSWYLQDHWRTMEKAAPKKQGWVGGACRGEELCFTS